MPVPVPGGDGWWSSFSSFAIFFGFFFAVDCKFFFWLPIKLPVQGRQRSREAITGQGFLAAHFCRVMHANWFMPTSLAKLLSHIMRSPPRRRVSFLWSSAVPGRTGTEECRIGEMSLMTVSDCTRDRQQTGSLPLTARLLALVIRHGNAAGVLSSIITALNAEEKSYSAVFWDTVEEKKVGLSGHGSILKTQDRNY